MKIFVELYPYLIIAYGVFIASVLTLLGCLLGFDMLRKDSRYDFSMVIPGLFWFCVCALLSGVALALTKFALSL